MKMNVRKLTDATRRFGSLQENEVKKLRDMEKENARLKRILAERDIELDVIREFLKKK